MKFNIKALSITCGVFCSGLFALCAVLVWLAPSFAIRIFNLSFHGILLNSEYIPKIIFSEFIEGLILTFILSALGAMIFGWLYNKLSK